MLWEIPKRMLLAAVVALVLAIPATATFPGKNGRIAFISISGSGTDLFTINPDGTHVQQLTSFGPNGGFVCCEAWSADGRQIVFAAEPNGTPVSQLWIMNSDGSNQRALLSEDSFFEQWPSFSPDGSQVAFSRCTLPDGHCAIYRISVSGTDLTQLTQYDTNPDVNDFVPAYSPDGKTVAFDSSSRGGVIFAIYLMNADGSNIRQLTPSAIEGANADWSPDGTTITFWTNLFAPLRSQIWTIHPDGTGLTQLTNPLNTYDSQPSWSPQQDAIVFERDNNTFTASALEIIRANGSRQNLSLQRSGPKSTFITPKERFIGKKRSGKGLQQSILNSGFFPRWGALPQ